MMKAKMLKPMGDICPTFILYFESRLEWQFKEMPFFALPYLLYLFFLCCYLITTAA